VVATCVGRPVTAWSGTSHHGSSEVVATCVGRPVTAWSGTSHHGKAFVPLYMSWEDHDLLLCLTLGGSWPAPVPHPGRTMTCSCASPLEDHGLLLCLTLGGSWPAPVPHPGRTMTCSCALLWVIVSMMLIVTESNLVGASCTCGLLQLLQGQLSSPQVHISVYLLENFG